MKLYSSRVIGKGTNVENKGVKPKRKNAKVKVEASRIVGNRLKNKGQRTNVKRKDQM